MCLTEMYEPQLNKQNINIHNYNPPPKVNGQNLKPKGKLLVFPPNKATQIQSLYHT